MVLNINMPQFVEENEAATSFSLRKVKKRMFQNDYDEAQDPEMPLPIFFNTESDDYGAFCPWYVSHFKGPSTHLGCEELVCDICEQSRISFTSAGQYIEYHKAIYFHDKFAAERILIRGKYTGEGYEDNFVHKRKDDVQTIAQTIRGFLEDVWNDFKDDVAVQAHLWKFSEEANCKTIGYKFVSSGTSLREQLQSTGMKSLVASDMNDDQWAELRRKYRFHGRECQSEECLERCLPGIQDDPRFHDDDEQDFWGDNLEGRFMMDIRTRIRNGEKPRKILEFVSSSDSAA